MRYELSSEIIAENTVLQDRVEAGATLLDEKYPDWFEVIAKVKLSIISLDRCVLGHLCGNFDTAVNTLGLPTCDAPFYVNHGFDVDYNYDCFYEGQNSRSFQGYVLEHFWKKAARARLYKPAEV